MGFKLSRTIAVLSIITLAGCGSGGGGKCVAGETKSCACTNGQNGAQTCGSDGTFGSCVCSGSVGGGSGGNAGGGTGGSVGGGAGGGAGGGSAGGGAGGGSAGGGAGGGAAGGGTGGTGGTGGAGGGSPVFTCVLPMTLDWGTVGKNSSTPKAIVLNNPTANDITATIGNVYSTTGDAPAFAQSGALGVVTIAAGTSQTATLTFTPTSSKTYSATVEIRVAASCPLQTISLTGTAVDAILTWNTPLDFGYAPQNFEVFKDLTFTNLGAVPVALTGLVASPEFRVNGATALTVPANGTAKVNLGFKPVLIGARGGSLSFTTDLTAQPTGLATLKGIGGGPTIEVTPSPTLAFGQVAYFAGANPPSFATRSLVIRNAGPAPAVPDPAANLKLGTPAFDVVALNAQTMLSEFAVTLNAAYPPAGLVSNATTDLQVKFTPASVGTKSVEITIHSNDLQTPDKKITVTADAVVLPPCTYTTSPASLNFGLLSGSKDFPVTFTNTGTGACQFSNIALLPSSHPSFSLPNGPIGALSVPAGQTAQVVVRAAPSGMTPATPTAIAGTLTFTVSSPTNPQGTVPLSASLGPSCLVMNPGSFDFGTVKQPSCNSPTVGFTLYNTCSTVVTINTASVTIGATEFLGVSLAGVAPNTTIAPSATAFFSLKYHPLDDGADTGAFSLGVTQNGVPVTYVLPLAGKGDTTGVNTDLTTVGASKVDVLLIVDDSGSMFDKQQKLGLNASAFFSASGAVDWQLGVTTTDDMVANGRLITLGGAVYTADGGLVADAGVPIPTPKIMNAQTPNRDNVFASKVNIGTNGSPDERSLGPAVTALTPPVSTNENAGFLRNDAALSIVSISDADDQSLQPVSFYVNQLLSLKPPGKLTWNAMAPTLPTAPLGCTYDVPGNRTPQTVAAIGGVIKEICDVDWAADLSQMSSSVFGTRADTYYLKTQPDLTGGKVITVKLDGTTIPPQTAGGSTIWSYDALSNAVVFTPFYIPQPGQTVSVSYTAVCL